MNGPRKNYLPGVAGAGVAGAGVAGAGVGAGVGAALGSALLSAGESVLGVAATFPLSSVALLSLEASGVAGFSSANAGAVNDKTSANENKIRI
jgi:hypothetical protein